MITGVRRSADDPGAAPRRAAPTRAASSWIDVEREHIPRRPREHRWRIRGNDGAAEIARPASRRRSRRGWPSSD
jgi:hypothetical protein